ncbi:hypothetical protein [Paraburkholderia sp. J12]|uniref:hypothetical protein n=1 Tax=Paraburkholderia sp. J12 TaxID=2805432 RepID=UPI002ABD794C|nr:hypothetical protein [Paraburkholderia sp. J12]
MIRDVIDAFRRLRESLYRLNCLLAPEADCAAAGTSLLPLLAGLAPHAGSAGAGRLRERKHALRDTRRLDKTRDALFSDTFCRDTDAMRQTIAELERLDALYVKWGVEHVLARHEPAPARVSSLKGTRSSRAAARPKAQPLAPHIEAA